MQRTSLIDRLEVPAPVLFNLWKHHGRAIRTRIDVTLTSLDHLPNELVVIGHELMDLYTGEFMPCDIARQLCAQLDVLGALDQEAYRLWIGSNNGYQMLELDDSSCWALRYGHNPERHIHIHPGRWSPGTQRVRANVLKTAILVHSHVRLHGGDVFDVELINAVREQYLALSAIEGIDPSEGLGLMIDTLRKLA